MRSTPCFDSSAAFNGSRNRCREQTSAAAGIVVCRAGSFAAECTEAEAASSGRQGVGFDSKKH